MLGGGLLPAGGLPEWVVRRLEGARHLHLQQQQQRTQQQQAFGSAAAAGAAGTPATGPSASDWQQPSAGAAAAAVVHSGCPIVLLGAGTPHKPPVLDDGGWVVHESTAYAAYLMRRGVPAAHLLKEACSYDTVGNGYFSLMIHALPAGWRCVGRRHGVLLCGAQLTVSLLLPAAAAGSAGCRRTAGVRRPPTHGGRSSVRPLPANHPCRRIAVVTSEFHMPRTRATFDTIYGLAGRQLHGDAAAFALDYWPGEQALVMGV